MEFYLSASEAVLFTQLSTSLTKTSPTQVSCKKYYSVEHEKLVLWVVFRMPFEQKKFSASQANFFLSFAQRVQARARVHSIELANIKFSVLSASTFYTALLLWFNKRA